MMRFLILFLTGAIFLSCEKDLQDITLVYENDFEHGLSEEISGASIWEFNQTSVSGNYNNDGFIVTVDHLPHHSQIMVTFDLYIHDSWDGNQQEIGGPDLWIMQVNDLNATPNNSRNIFQTTFSNSSCNYMLCLYQSYPEEYPFSRSPRSGALNVDIPGTCYLSESLSGTSLYKIKKTFHHKGETLFIRFYDRLTQTNTFEHKCDESWSLDNLKVWTLNFD